MAASHRFRILFAAISVLIVTSSPKAQATLGEIENSIDSDAAAMHGTLEATTTVGHIRAQKMTTKRADVKQYMDADGRVYAISWTGMKHPDLSVLMGSYYSEYSSALSQRQGRSFRRNSTVTTQRAVIHLSGVPRHMHGLVYVPALLPSGVKAEDLK